MIELLHHAAPVVLALAILFNVITITKLQKANEKLELLFGTLEDRIDDLVALIRSDRIIQSESVLAVEGKKKKLSR